MRFNLEVYILVCIVDPLRGFRVFTSLQKVVFTNVDDEVPEDVHSEYYFGKCSTRRRELMLNITKKFEEVEGKMIDRGWLTIDEKVEPPRCVYVRARSKYGDLVRYHAFKFNFCICTIVYSYRSQTFRYVFYEWYMPVEMSHYITWEVFFYT